VLAIAAGTKARQIFNDKKVDSKDLKKSSSLRQSLLKA